MRTGSLRLALRCESTETKMNFCASKILGWKSLRWATWLAGWVLVLGSSASGRAAITIVDQGKSPYRLVIAGDAIPSERYAAEELQRYLEKISGANLPIVSDAGPME